MSWEYNDYYKKHDMSGTIEVGTGTVKVHDIFEPLPDFVKQADCIFVDPPCSLSNINSFYTKADRLDYQQSYLPFHNRLFECIDEIAPKRLFLEVFVSNFEAFKAECEKRFKNVRIYNTTYYFNRRNKCYILACDNEESLREYLFEGMDEETVIEWICREVDYECIGDLCMGQGLVGWYANQAGKRFVGIELNPKRLAVLVESIETNKKLQGKRKSK